MMNPRQLSTLHETLNRRSRQLTIACTGVRESDGSEVKDLLRVPGDALRSVDEMDPICIATTTNVIAAILRQALRTVPSGTTDFRTVANSTC